MEMFNRLSIPKKGKCQRKAIAPDSSASQVLSDDNGLPSGRCPRHSWLLPRYRPFIWPGIPSLDQKLSAGVIFMCFTIDYRILHVKITPEATRDATHFYTLFYNAPPAIKVGLAFVRCRHVTDNPSERLSFTR